MPSIIKQNAKTVYVDDKPWSSPDGKVTIWNIKLEIDGERDLWSTMSKQVATEGWQGDIEVYTNDKGKTYVRKAPKEEQQSFGNPGSSSGYHDNSDGQRQGMCFNNAAAYLNYVADPGKALTPNKWAAAVWTYAQALYQRGDLNKTHEDNLDTPVDSSDHEAIKRGLQADDVDMSEVPPEYR